jgi:hypothetical protein
MITKAENATNGFCTWNSEKSMGVAFYENQLLPDIFIYLVNEKNEKVCFLRYFPF